jgi:hypothetical protein
MSYSIVLQDVLKVIGFMNINSNAKRDRNIMGRDFFLKKFRRSKILHHSLKMEFLIS